MRFNNLTAFICAVAVFAAAFFYEGNTEPIFSSQWGTYTFYLYSRSSNAQICAVRASEAKNACKTIKNICGESLFVEGDDSFAKREIERLNAQLQFIEQSAGVTSKYYYSPEIRGYMSINGYKVNLHAAFSQSGTTIGSPIIFGSF